MKAAKNIVIFHKTLIIKRLIKYVILGAFTNNCAACQFRANYAEAFVKKYI